MERFDQPGTAHWTHAEILVETIAQPVLLLDAERRVVAANGAFCRSYATSVAATVGRRIHDLGAGAWDTPELHRLFDDGLGGQDQVEEVRLEQTLLSTERRVMLVNARRMQRGEDGERTLLAFTDITETERQRDEITGRQEFDEKLIDSIREGLVVLDRELRIHTANKSFYEQFRLTPAETVGVPIYRLDGGEWDIPELRGLLEDIVPQHESFDDFEVEREFPRVGHRVMLLNARRLDHLQLVILALRDVTEERDHTRRQETFMHELQHRVKNILANVQALASQTRRHSRDLDEFTQSFQARLSALSRAQDLLVRDPHDAVALARIVRTELQAMGAREGRDYTLSGAEVSLKPRHAQALAMAIHELTTNAGKYGALRTAEGHIDIAWQLDHDSGMLTFTWRERGLTLPTTERRKGLGTRMIEQSVPGMLGGTARFDLETEGASCEIAFPITD